MRNILSLIAIGLMTTVTSSIFASSTLDVDGNLPAAADGSTTTLADGTTLTLTEYTGGLGSIYPNTSSSDFDFGSSSPGAGNYSYIVLDITFGSDFGVAMDGLVSAQDFELGVSSLNGSSNWYEFGFLDLKGVGGTVTTGAIDTYLANTANYQPGTFVSIGSAVGADVANDELNNFDGAGTPVSSTGSTNDTWDNTDFGLAPETAISGFTFFYGAVTSDGRSSSPGASIGNFEDAMTLQAVPEPSALSLLLAAACFTYLRRRR